MVFFLLLIEKGVSSDEVQSSPRVENEEVKYPENLSVQKSLDKPAAVRKEPLDFFENLVVRSLLLNIAFAILALVISLTFFDFNFSMSLLLGSVFGILYLRLLSKNILKLGTNTNSVGKFQLILPILLVLLSSKSHQVELLPAFMGFILYKPSLIIQFLFQPK